MSAVAPHFHFVTLFPETIQVWLTTSILGRAHRSGLFHFSLYQLRDFSKDKHRSVDDVAYGGGGGMVLRLEPLVDVVEMLKAKFGREATRVIYFSPAGRPLGQPVIDSYRKGGPQHFILICGHYEGVDQRFIDHWVDDEISLGDFVLTGGELPAVAFADALIRHCDGVLGDEAAPKTESFSLSTGSGKPLLEYPHYTRPAVFRGLPVPEVLTSGDHGKVEAWRGEESLRRTQTRRPELL